jgi:hypothetical protein
MEGDRPGVDLMALNGFLRCGVGTIRRLRCRGSQAEAI